MFSRNVLSAAPRSMSYRLLRGAPSQTCWACARIARGSASLANHQSSAPKTAVALFSTTRRRPAQGPTADILMDNLNDLYATAKDEFEIAAEETEKKTVYAQDDRDAAREALEILKKALDKAMRESDPDVSKEVRTRIGRKIQELENAVIAMEESAMEE